MLKTISVCWSEYKVREGECSCEGKCFCRGRVNFTELNFVAFTSSEGSSERPLSVGSCLQNHSKIISRAGAAPLPSGTFPRKQQELFMKSDLIRLNLA